MDDRGDALEEAIQQIAALLAEAYLRLRLQARGERTCLSRDTERSCDWEVEA